MVCATLYMTIVSSLREYDSNFERTFVAWTIDQAAKSPKSLSCFLSSFIESIIMRIHLSRSSFFNRRSTEDQDSATALWTSECHLKSFSFFSWLFGCDERWEHINCHVDLMVSGSNVSQLWVSFWETEGINTCLKIAWSADRRVKSVSGVSVRERREKICETRIW